MRKKAVSVTLGVENLLWLRSQARMRGRRSVSETLDGVITEARTGGERAAGSTRPMVGRVRISDADPDLATADAAIRALFQASLGRTPATRPPGRARRTGAPAAKRG
jgi:hypothetical protein